MHSEYSKYGHIELTWYAPGLKHGSDFSNVVFANQFAKGLATKPINIQQRVKGHYYNW